jgi:hypothetical protein
MYLLAGSSDGLWVAGLAVSALLLNICDAAEEDALARKLGRSLPAVLTFFWDFLNDVVASGIFSLNLMWFRIGVPRSLKILWSLQTGQSKHENCQKHLNKSWKEQTGT